MRAHDIVFTMNSGDKVGQKYGFTLARSKGQKMWSAVRLFQPPPNMAKERIDIGIVVREKNIPLSGATELKLSDKLIEQLEIVAKETTPVTLLGFDGIKRDVRVDAGGFNIEPVVDEKGRMPEYVAKMTVWSVY